VLLRALIDAIAGVYALAELAREDARGVGPRPIDDGRGDRAVEAVALR
jgi:hypothetical protein